jgi:hypothetical protein
MKQASLYSSTVQGGGNRRAIRSPRRREPVVSAEWRNIEGCVYKRRRLVGRTRLATATSFAWFGSSRAKRMSALGQKQTSHQVQVMSALPAKRTWLSAILMSAKCHKQAHAPQQTAAPAKRERRRMAPFPRRSDQKTGCEDQSLRMPRNFDVARCDTD